MLQLELSIIVCVLNEELNIEPLVKNLRTVLHGYSYEIVYVDDGSKDNTLSILKSLIQEDLKIIELRKNFGQSSALAAGIQFAKGQFLVTMDGDLQNDPSDIPLLLEKAKSENWDLVAGIRANRKDGMFLRKIPSGIANYIIQKSSGIKIKDYGCTLKIFRSEIAKDLGLYGELHRFIPVLAHLQGAKITQMEVKHHAREFGTSKYGINRTFKVISDLILMLFFNKYLQKPMHLFGTWGLGFLFSGVMVNLYLVARKFLLNEDIGTKPLLTLGVLLIITGFQLFTFGIIVEIQTRTYYESQNKTPYKVRNIFSK